MVRDSRAEFKTYGNVFDTFTITLLQRLISRRIIDNLKGQLFVGKESNIFTAKRGEEEVIVKIYRLQNCNFNQMYDMIKCDRRYVNLRKNRREIIFGWAQREYRNLLIARDAGVLVPTAYAFSKHVLILSLIGDKDPAPPLKDTVPENPEKMQAKIFAGIRKMARKNLVHGDLSAFNILNWREEPYFIDFSQATTYENLNGLRYLKRDVHNIATWFSKHGVKTDEEKEITKILKEIPTRE